MSVGVGELSETLVGTVLDGRFEVKALLGEGGLGTVYRVRDRELGRDVALKVLIPRYRGRPERESRLLAEASMARRVEHPGVVQCLGSGRLSDLGGCPSAEFELVVGDSLNVRLAREGAFEPLRAAGLTRELGDRVRACHVAGLVHRDVSVQNVFLGEGDRLTLIDFSHAAPLEQAQERATLHGDIPGAPWYMSPEQARGERATASMDVFAVGVVGYELLTGRNPYQNVQVDVFAELQGREELAQPKIDSRVFPAVPERLAEVINRCLVLRASDRIPLEGLMAQLDEVLEEMGRDVGSTPGGPAREEPTGPTMLMRRPPVLANGARPAGDETMVRLVRSGVQMPSVKRVGAELEKAERDECLVVHKAQVHAALGLKKTPAPATADDHVNPSSTVRVEEPEPVVQEGGSGWAKVVFSAALVFAALAVGGAIALKPSLHTLRQGGWEVPSVATAGLAGSTESAEEAAPDSEKLDAGSEDEALPVEPLDSEGKPSTAEPPELEPAKVRRPKPKKERPAPLPTVVGEKADTDACKALRTAAKGEHDRGAPRGVLKKTRDRSCWKGHAEDRRYLRASAFFDQRDYEACAQAARGGESSDTRALARICTSKMKDPS